MKRFFSDMSKYYKYSVYSAKASLKDEVASSYLNWLWWILDPLFLMLIYVFIFTVIFPAGKEPIFPAFIFLGLTIWGFFDKTISQSIKLVKGNKAIVTKVYIPKYILLIITMMKNGFKMLISFGIVVIMMLFYRVPPNLNMLYIVLVIATLFIVTFAGGTILLHLGVFVEDLSNVVRIILKLLFYMSGIFFNIAERVPKPYGWWALRINPVGLAIQAGRESLLYNTTPDIKWLIYWIIAGIVVATIGVTIIYKNENGYAKVV